MKEILFSQVGDPERWEGMQVLCELPRALGEVTKLSVKNGSVIAETASGIDFIAPKILRYAAESEEGK